MAMDIKRRMARGVAVIAIALGAGQLVQSMAERDAKPRVAQGETTQKTKHVETLAGGAETVKPAADPALVAPKLPETSLATTEPAAPIVAETPPAAVAQTTPAPAVAAVDPCPVTLDLASAENAMIAITMRSPCHPNERVVVKHAGLAITAQTLATGALITDLPALEQQAKVEVLFKDGRTVAGSVAIPEIRTVRRFAVQWQADDAFQLHAFEDDSGYDGPGHVSGADPHRPAAGVPAKAGFLMRLGDASTDLPLLAELYTYPADPALKPEIVVEAAVTATACGREMLGETLTSLGGAVSVSDLTVAMPECDAVGDYLVLKNLVPDLNIAASN